MISRLSVAFDCGDVLTTQVSVESQGPFTFNHFAEADVSEFASCAPAMWASIRYPAQMMHSSKIWKSFPAASPSQLEAGSGNCRGHVVHALEGLEEQHGAQEAQQLARLADRRAIAQTW